MTHTDNTTEIIGKVGVWGSLKNISSEIPFDLRILHRHRGDGERYAAVARIRFPHRVQSISVRASITPLITEQGARELGAHVEIGAYSASSGWHTYLTADEDLLGIELSPSEDDKDRAIRTITAALELARTMMA